MELDPLILSQKPRDCPNAMLERHVFNIDRRQTHLKPKALTKEHVNDSGVIIPAAFEMLYIELSCLFFFFHVSNLRKN